jgi:hypothetical protein
MNLDWYKIQLHQHTEPLRDALWTLQNYFLFTNITMNINWFRNRYQLKATLCVLNFMTCNYIMLLPEMVFDSTLKLQSRSCHVMQYIYNTTLVCINNFHHTLIIYKDFIILCLVHFNVYCNFTCKYVLTSRILHLVTHFMDMYQSYSLKMALWELKHVGVKQW